MGKSAALKQRRKIVGGSKRSKKNARSKSRGRKKTANTSSGWLKSEASTRVRPDASLRLHWNAFGGNITTVALVLSARDLDFAGSVAARRDPRPCHITCMRRRGRTPGFRFGSKGFQ